MRCGMVTSVILNEMVEMTDLPHFQQVPALLLTFWGHKIL